MDFSDQDKRMLSHLGRTEDGRDLMKILSRAKAHYSSLSSIDSKLAPESLAAQVAGRHVFIAFIDDLIERMKIQGRPLRPNEPEDYE